MKSTGTIVLELRELNMIADWPFKCSDILVCFEYLYNYLQSFIFNNDLYNGLKDPLRAHLDEFLRGKAFQSKMRLFYYVCYGLKNDSRFWPKHFGLAVLYWFQMV